MVALHLDNSTAKAFLCNQGGTASPVLSRLAYHILNLVNKYGITLIPAYICSHFDVEGDLSIMGKVGTRVAPSSSHS